MSTPNSLRSSTDFVDSPPVILHPTISTVPTTRRLHDNLKTKADAPIVFVEENSMSSTVSETEGSILNEDGSINLNKFTNTMLHSNVSMTRHYNQDDNSRFNMKKLREKRLLDNPPLILYF